MEKYAWFQTEWYTKMEKSMRVSGLSERSRKVYSRAMRMLVEHVDKTPDLISEEALLDYFLYRQEDCGWSPSTMRICHAGIKFFFQNVLKQDWHVLKLAQAKREKRLPAVLSREEVGRIMGQISTYHNYAYLMTVYTCGLRLQEGLFLEISDIDGARKMIHIHRGKGARDRYIPLPEATLELLRNYWRSHRNTRLIFPAVGRSRKKAPVSEHPMSIDGVQGAFRQAKFAAGIKKRGVSVHTLRHYAEFRTMPSCHIAALINKDLRIIHSA